MYIYTCLCVDILKTDAFPSSTFSFHLKPGDHLKYTRQWDDPRFGCVPRLILHSFVVFVYKAVDVLDEIDMKVLVCMLGVRSSELLVVFYIHIYTHKYISWHLFAIEALFTRRVWKREIARDWSSKISLCHK